MAEKKEENINILQIDVEDWYCDLDFKDWDLYENRLVQNTEKILSILRETQSKATFFILGYFAEKFPELVREIKKEGHEIGSHGYNHDPVTKQSFFDFEKGILNSVSVLEKITGEKVLGYRAPQFTVVEKTAWAIDILKKIGLKYDSSVFPVKTPLYGVPGAPLFPYRISSNDIKKENLAESFLEIPLSVYKMPFFKKNIGIAGGFYLRLFPYFFIHQAIKKINKLKKPAVCYLHPWELDNSQPRIKKLKWYHYYNLSNTEKKFKRLLKDFKFVSTKSWIEKNGK